MKLTIRTYWNKVIDDATQPFGTRVLPEYVLKDTVSYANSGWNNVKEWGNSVKARHGFQGFDESGAARFDGRKSYGIHQFQLVSLS